MTLKIGAVFQKIVIYCDTGGVLRDFFDNFTHKRDGNLPETTFYFSKSNVLEVENFGQEPLTGILEIEVALKHSRLEGKTFLRTLKKSNHRTSLLMTMMAIAELV